MKLRVPKKKMLENSWVAELLTVSEGGLSCMELIS
jgi:hypothetical protein